MLIVLYFNFDRYILLEKIDFREVLNLDVQIGSGSDPVTKYGSGFGSHQNTRILNPVPNLRDQRTHFETNLLGVPFILLGFSLSFTPIIGTH